MGFALRRPGWTSLRLTGPGYLRYARAFFYLLALRRPGRTSLRLTGPGYLRYARASFYLLSPKRPGRMSLRSILPHKKRPGTWPGQLFAIAVSFIRPNIPIALEYHFRLPSLHWCTTPAVWMDPSGKHSYCRHLRTQRQRNSDDRSCQEVRRH